MKILTWSFSKNAKLTTWNVKKLSKVWWFFSFYSFSAAKLWSKRKNNEKLRCFLTVPLIFYQLSTSDLYTHVTTNLYYCHTFEPFSIISCCKVINESFKVFFDVFNEKFGFKNLKVLKKTINHTQASLEYFFGNKFLFIIYLQFSSVFNFRLITASNPLQLKYEQNLHLLFMRETRHVNFFLFSLQARHGKDFLRSR